MEIISVKNCPITKALEVLGGKWKLRIIYHIVEDKPVRYGELRRYIPEISEKMLLQELRSLVENKILEKRSYLENTLRVEYTLTKKGKEVLPLIKMLAQIGMNFLGE
ncbi:winged helix-turn-helix transcriptional regulator [Chitinophaga solisilvae]|uniref:winged helix-turn-helix transcriptional regulator n=1 Tax=Chitinophaga solisilvae TaxID=1233460 RepID=UPI00136BA66B|nr:helix-turn-helix domain-containing protein [Chitinophaga solisilvae]